MSVDLAFWSCQIRTVLSLLTTLIPAPIHVFFSSTNDFDNATFSWASLFLEFAVCSKGISSSYWWHPKKMFPCLYPHKGHCIRYRYLNTSSIRFKWRLPDPMLNPCVPLLNLFLIAGSSNWLHRVSLSSLRGVPFNTQHGSFANWWLCNPK